MKRTRVMGGLPFFVRQELAIHRDDDAIPLGILLLLHVQLEADRAHDAVAEHLVDDRLERRAIDLGDLVESVDERIDVHRLIERALGSGTPGARLLRRVRDPIGFTSANGCGRHLRRISVMYQRTWLALQEAIPTPCSNQRHARNASQYGQAVCRQGY
jgi:hypothetical protein